MQINNKYATSPQKNLGKLVTRLIAFASKSCESDTSLSICITSPTNSLDDLNARRHVCLALALAYEKLKFKKSQILTVIPDDSLSSSVRADANSSIVEAGVVCKSISYAELLPEASRSTVVENMLQECSLVVIDAGSIESSAPVFWKESADVVSVVIDTPRTTDIMLDRLKKETETLGLRVDGAIMINFPCYVPDFLYENV